MATWISFQSDGANTHLILLDLDAIKRFDCNPKERYILFRIIGDDYPQKLTEKREPQVYRYVVDYIQRTTRQRLV